MLRLKHLLGACYDRVEISRAPAVLHSERVIVVKRNMHHELIHTGLQSPQHRFKLIRSKTTSGREAVETVGIVKLRLPCRLGSQTGDVQESLLRMAREFEYVRELVERLHR